MKRSTRIRNPAHRICHLCRELTGPKDTDVKRMPMKGTPGGSWLICLECAKAAVRKGARK